MTITKIPELPVVDPKPGVAPTGAFQNILIARMSEKADLSQEALMPRGPERKQAVYDDLVATAQRSQVDAIGQLKKLQTEGLVTSFETMFMPNAILITAAKGQERAVTQALSGVAEIADVVENSTWSIDTPSDAGADAAKGAATLASATATAQKVEWGVEKIGAPKLWEKGITGAGVTIGIVDTGLDSSHPLIAPHYRGTQADGSQSHDFNWFDPLDRSAVAEDSGSHGTHVGGTAAGGSPDHAIGVAPGAKLIASKAIMGSGYNTTAATMHALQFMLAPTKTDGSSPSPKLGADIVNNSWGNSDLNDTTFIDSFDALKAAGIVVVTSAGNSGPRGKVSPPGSYPGHISVASSTRGDDVSGFSSRGPSKFAGKDELVPNLTAPGSSITSAVPGGRTRTMSGTSMASPHISGAVALLLSAFPTASQDQIINALEATAVDIDQPGTDIASGYGRIDVEKAHDLLAQAVAEQAA